MTIKVNIVMGGPSAENEISLRSGREVICNIDRTIYAVKAVVVTKTKEFYYCAIDSSVPSPDEIANPQSSSAFKGPFSPANSAEIWDDCNVAFLALHGEFGEDGVVQGYLDTLGIPYTGSGVFGSAVAMNKIASKYLYIQSGLEVPPYSVFGKHIPNVTVESISAKHGFPNFVKCPQSGSSRLMGRSENKEQLASLLEELGPFSDEILIESAISGPEFTCGVIDMPDGTLKALPPVEIRPKSSSFFDFEAKYTDGASEDIVPAPRPEQLLKRIQDVATIAHRALGCECVSRTDMILQNDKLYVLETNTLPGLTPISLLPRAFKAIGGTYSEMLDILIQTAINKNKS
jgi:D-alanine-D-alanine ligase